MSHDDLLTACYHRVHRQPLEATPEPSVNDQRDQALRDEGWEYNQERGGFQRVPKP